MSAQFPKMVPIVAKEMAVRPAALGLPLAGVRGKVADAEAVKEGGGPIGRCPDKKRSVEPE
jgi:hypothetical protein